MKELFLNRAKENLIDADYKLGIKRQTAKTQLQNAKDFLEKLEKEI